MPHKRSENENVVYEFMMRNVRGRVHFPEYGWAWNNKQQYKQHTGAGVKYIHTEIWFDVLLLFKVDAFSVGK